MKYVANTGDETVLQEYQRLLAREQVDKDIRAMEWMLGHELGRWFLARMFEACQLKGATFTGNSGTFYNEGRRDVAVSFYKLIRLKLGVDGLKKLHRAELEMAEFEERCRQAAEEKEEEDDDD